MTTRNRSTVSAGTLARPSLTRLELSAAWALMCIGLFFLGGCATDTMRTVVVHQPLTARPAAPPPAPPPAQADGAIFKAASYQPLFEDRRARNVGDTLTIRIDEKLNASKTANTNTDRKGSSTFNLSDVKFGNTNVFKGGSITGGSDLKFEGGGDSGAKNVFTGSITVTVIEVLPNSNLVVSGEKQIGINTGSEFVRLSGVVNPVTILAGNVVSSIQVADARLEYRGAGVIDEANTMGWLARVFQSVLPF